MLLINTWLKVMFRAFSYSFSHALIDTSFTLCNLLLLLFMTCVVLFEVAKVIIISTWPYRSIISHNDNFLLISYPI